ncbi:LuxR family transcriptional regulator [Conexibacter sp. SYSU D00693]|uniref:helix-turn-helix transcriptional regulator n=1 Tax=Conexibacter sp. SYSU D00693 TaxID=2812560 RepID=UPI0021122FD3|nr:LuxR family transcriptional regulator [Conexibacter sp. SYSU D00693]
MHLVGLQGERERVGRLLAGARDGQGAALLVRGEAGIGKSALLGAAAEQAAGLPVLALRARGHEAEAGIPSGGLADLLEPVLGLRDRLPAVQARALGGALGLEPPAPADREALPLAVLTLLREAAREQPVVVLVDDVQWLGRHARLALGYAARRLSGPGIVLLLAARAGHGVEDDLAGVEVLDLRPLARDDAFALVRQATSDGPLVDAVARRVVDAAAGNPRALLELPGLLDPEQRAGREPLPWLLPAPPALHEQHAVALAALAPATRTALLCAAAMASGRTDVLDAGLAELGLDAGALAPAERAGLLTVGSRATFRHPLLRAVVYHAAPAAERRRVHAALSVVSPDRGRRAWHAALAAVAPDEALATAMEAAAQDPETRGEQAVVAQGLARAAQLSQDPDAKVRRRLAAAAAWIRAGFPVQALATLEATERAGVAEGVPAARLRGLRGRAELQLGATATALADLVGAARAAEAAGDPGLAARLVLEAGGAQALAGEAGARVRLATTAAALARTARDPLACALADGLRAHAHAIIGEEEAAAPLLDRALPVLLDAGRALLDVPAEVPVAAALAAAWLERPEPAAALLDRLVLAAREARAPAQLVAPLWARALLDVRRGRWSAALADAREAHDVALTGGLDGPRAVAAATVALAEALRGDGDAAREHAKAALALTEAEAGSATAVLAHHALGLDALGRGDAELAGEWLDRAARIAGAARLGRSIIAFGADRVEAHARAGRSAAAHEALEAFADGAGGGRWALAALARCRGLLATGADHEDHFETALADHERERQPWERARTLLAYGERLRRERRRADAREMLVGALASFERLGSDAWAERTRIELRATGQGAVRTAPATTAPEPTPEALAAAGLDELTPHELQIARLVSYGMTNREVAGKLFLSPKTIEYHLSSIYRKLGLRSRTQLAKLVASEVPGLAGQAAA